ncbi:MAG: threonine/serine exporter family protein [Bacteroidales bacterium]|jgi:uncharacterized membrane protein YjjB (DUF3815 family)|nr:threonine/serine exporter family protein [Bacteroidales bacterium]
MIAVDILLDALFAAIAGIGFGAISNPPRRAFAGIALLAAVGHAARYSLMTYFGAEIASASFVAACIISFGGVWLAKKVHVPTTVLCIPAVLPMIPGKFAYDMVFSLIMFLKAMDNPEEKVKYMNMLFSNTIVTTTVIFLLAVGITFPMLLFPKRTSSMTRRKNRAK